MCIKSKYISFIFLIICVIIYQNVYSQDPFKILDKAERVSNKGNYEKALKKIDRAERIVYCTCGLCGIELNRRANLLRYVIYNNLGEYQLSRQFLDSIDFGNEQIDSLKVLSYQNEYGKEFLSSKIDSSLLHINMECDKYSCYYVNIPLTRSDVKIRFKIGLMESSHYLIKNKEERVDEWRKQFLKSAIYKMIKEKS